MCELHFPWLELATILPLIGALMVFPVRLADVAWRRSVAISALVLLLTVGAWVDFIVSDCAVARDGGRLALLLFGDGVFVIDQVSAPLIPLAALLHFVVTLSTLRTKARRFRFAWSLVSLALAVELLSCRSPWGIVILSIAQLVPPWVELRARGRSTRVFTLHMGLFAVLLVAGWTFVDFGVGEVAIGIGICLIAAAALIRNGAAPVHCWMTDLFENAGFGTALLFVTPLPAAYIIVRLVLPLSPDWVLQSIAIVSLVTAIYASGMALIQRDARRFFCYLLLSNASLVLVGLELASPTSVTGGLALWLSVGISLAGLGLTLRAVESRCGRLSLADYHGLYEHMPRLAAFYLLTSLASIGFPGTIGFIGAELLVEGVVHLTPLVGIIVVLTGALNGIAVMRVYFRLFTGTRHTSSVTLEAQWPEKAAVLALTLLILGGGLLPQPGVMSRFRAANEILARRQEVAQLLVRSSPTLPFINTAKASVDRESQRE